MSSSVIAVDALTKRYAARTGTVSALEEISFSVGEGEFVAVVGPSGCGKSTLLKILAGILSATAGEARLRGTAIAGPRKDIGVVFQAPVLFPWRSVLDNVLLPIDVQGLGRDGHRQDAMDLLNLVGLQGFEGRYPWELSGGMQQRVAITRALVHDPALLLMAIPEAVFLADRVLVMTPRPGKILEDVRVKSARPRSLDIMNTPEFGEHVRRIRAHFNVKGGIDA